MAVEPLSLGYSSPHHLAFPEMWAPNAWVEDREGQVLSQNMILKTDQFPSGVTHMTVSGAPNYRQVGRAPVVGVAQPTMFGMRTILNLLRSRTGAGWCVQWINLREEPVVYLNSRPFILRPVTHPFRNLKAFRGVHEKRLTRIEERLRQDILEESSLNDGNLLIHQETRPREVRNCWECVRQSGVLTSAQVFDAFRDEGYSIEYHRIPVTPEAPFSVQQTEALRTTFHHADPASVFVFNCQMGAGRSTMGTIIMTMLLRTSGRLQQRVAAPEMQRHFSGTHSSAIPSRNNSTNSLVDVAAAAAELVGDYAIVSRLLRVLQHGTEAKKLVDDAIHACSAIHNPLQSIRNNRMQLESARTADLRLLAARKCVKSLGRYYSLICFGAYLVKGRRNFQEYMDRHTFVDFMNSHPELTKMAEVINENEVTTALGPSHAVSGTDTFVRSRKGVLLGKGIIVKREFLPQDVQCNDLTCVVGAPNFRQVAGTPLAALAQPTLHGVSNVLALLSEASDTVVRSRASVSQQQRQQQRLRGSMRSATGDQAALIRQVFNGTKTKTKKHPTGARQSVCWVNLREEPVVYIRKKPFVLRDATHPFRCLPEFDVGMSGERSEQIEERLKEELLKEIHDNKDSLLVHYESHEQSLSSRWKPLTSPDVQSPREVFTGLTHQHLTFHHIPLKTNDIMSFEQFDLLFDILRDAHAQTKFVFHCQMGRKRSTVATVIAALVLRHRGMIDATVFTKDSSEDVQPAVAQTDDIKEENGKPADDQDEGDDEEEEEDVSLQRSSSDSHPEQQEWFEYRGILNLIRILRTGRMVQEEVDDFIDLCSATYHVKDAIFDARVAWETAREEVDQEELLKQAMKSLETYVLLICFNAYLREVFFSSRSSWSRGSEASVPSQETFTQWMHRRAELTHLLTEMREEPEAALTLDRELTGLGVREGDADGGKDLAVVFEARRKGNVLVAQSIMKSDYFVGCKNPNVPQIVEGSPNFRKVHGFDVCGSAIPGGNGVDNVISLILDANFDSLAEVTSRLACMGDARQQLFPCEDDQTDQHGGAGNRVIWVNLREEPVLYIRGRPFVLRDFHSPYSNLTYTGINTKRLHAMEKQLKRDAWLEAGRLGGKLLLHDEDDDGQLLVQWGAVAEGDIETCQEFYQRQFRACGLPESFYVRIPITDEEAPLPHTFDLILKSIAALHRDDERCVAVFNCQMGRGRTTTGCIIYCLWKLRRMQLDFAASMKHLYGLLRKDFSPSRHPSLFSAEFTPPPASPAVSSSHDSPYGLNVSVSTDHDKEEKRRLSYLNGDYRAVRDLLRLIPDGKQVKAEVDTVIDLCSHMQNLREAIYPLKLRSESAVQQSARDSALERGQKYLVRYVYLIVFNAYLRWRDQPRHDHTFASWLQVRPEIVNVIHHLKLA